MANSRMPVFTYFRAPFPSAQGFSPYRFPGMMAHLPLLLASVFTGFLLCWPHPVLRLLLVVWILAGLYLGRDFAILCHYAPFLVLVVWAAAAILVAKAPAISKFGASHTVIPAVISFGVAVVFIAHVYRSNKER
ncbi:MAG TPA: hypothetical protein VK699_15475 [Terriglobales bacterium]|nr:hypothetical protein [Terriglobales bacterium]